MSHLSHGPHSCTKPLAVPVSSQQQKVLFVTPSCRGVRVPFTKPGPSPPLPGPRGSWWPGRAQQDWTSAQQTPLAMREGGMRDPGRMSFLQGAAREFQLRCCLLQQLNVLALLFSVGLASRLFQKRVAYSDGGKIGLRVIPSLVKTHLYLRYFLEKFSRSMRQLNINSNDSLESHGEEQLTQFKAWNNKSMKTSPQNERKDMYSCSSEVSRDTKHLKMKEPFLFSGITAGLGSEKTISQCN